MTAHVPTSSAMIAGDVLDKQYSQRTPLVYRSIRFLFKQVSRVFYKQIEVVGLSLLPPDGVPTCVSSHVTEIEKFTKNGSTSWISNSLTDPTLLIGNIPSSSRNLLRLTAKDSHFRRGGLSSRLIEGAGAIPVMRQKDHIGVQNVEVENRRTFAKLVEALHHGDCVVLFPEGISRYFPTIAPLRTGVSRIASQFLSTSQNDNAKLNIVTASITYTARERFRSNVLISFSAPILVDKKSHPNLVLPENATEGQQMKAREAVRQLTSQIEDGIRSGCLDAPSWKLLKTAQTARRLYAPASGRDMSLFLYVKLTQKWVDILAREDDQVMQISQRLRAYERKIQKLGLKDQRVLLHTQLPTIILLRRLLTRFLIASALSLLASPAIVIWAPTLLVTKYQERQFKHQSRTKPKWDVWDEIAQTKLVYGLISLVATYFLLVLLTLPFVTITIWAIPLLLLGLRAWEKLISSIRGFLALARVLRLHNEGSGRGLVELVSERQGLQQDIVKLAAANGLPEDYRVWLDKHKTTDRPSSLSRRVSSMAFSGRVNNWDSTMRLWDHLDADSDDEEERII